MLALALLFAPFLAACTEDLLKEALGDPVPSITAGEDSTPPSGKLCIDCTVAEFNQDTGRVTLPNDAVLASLNETLAARGSPTIDGTQKAMPIRIPFDGVIQYPFTTGATPCGAEIAAWGASVFFFATDDPTTIIPALPISATGTFKAVYLDANNDLVLVPGASTFANDKTYVGVVTKAILDASGNPIDEAYVTGLLKLDTPLVDSFGHSTISLLDNEQAVSLEVLR